MRSVISPLVYVDVSCMNHRGGESSEVRWSAFKLEYKFALRDEGAGLNR